MSDIKWFVLISWFALPTVMYGGYSALVTLRGMLSEHQQHFFRLGHAHAGVLLVMSLIYYHYLSLTSFSANTKIFLCSLLLVGVVMQSGGFFWHAFLDKGGIAIGMHITTLGAICMAAAIITLGIKLFSSL